ncbi:MAG: Do family serine endopeptidase [Gammaproteobacteria bacterium]|nr:Do family serine endopeptidase [Gammaproteobacteria bacterium]
MHKTLPFLFQSVTIGLALAFLLLLWRPELLTLNQTVVEVKESPEAVQRISPGNAIHSYADAVDAAAPAVVNIHTLKVVVQRSNPLFDDPFFRRFFGEGFLDQPRKRLETNLGSGVVISPQGYLLTNNHVIEGAEEIQVALRDGRNAAAEVVGADPESDIAVLKIDLPDLPSMTLSNSEKLRIGDVVLAIGNPFGVGQTVTMGIISATGRSKLGISTFENFIQTDAAINPGNSGGALINTNGELLGINTAIFSRSGGSQGIGFAIPMSLAKGIMEQIIEQGHVSRGWLGIEVQSMTQELAESFNMKTNEGALVAGIVREGPADLAGIQPGDILIKIDGKKVSDLRETLNAITQTNPGNKLGINLIRNGKEIELKATVAERPVQP